MAVWCLPRSNLQSHLRGVPSWFAIGSCFRVDLSPRYSYMNTCETHTTRNYFDSTGIGTTIPLNSWIQGSRRRMAPTKARKVTTTTRRTRSHTSKQQTDNIVEDPATLGGDSNASRGDAGFELVPPIHPPVTPGNQNDIDVAGDLQLQHLADRAELQKTLAVTKGRQSAVLCTRSKAHLCTYT